MNKHDYLILFDDGNVLNHNGLREGRYRIALAEFMIARYGGEVDKWIEINTNYIKTFMAEFHQLAQDRTLIDFIPYFQNHKIQWGTALLDGYQIPIPSKLDLLTLFDEATAYINPRAASPNEGIIELIHRLYDDNFRLVTASGEISQELTFYLQGFGDNIISKFEKLYGPDLINTPKFVPDFFQKILKDCHIPPERAILIDDNPNFIENAHHLGMHTILCEISNPLGDRAIPLETFRVQSADEIYTIITEKIVLS